jgi:hypothetical protein
VNVGKGNVRGFRLGSVMECIKKYDDHQSSAGKEEFVPGATSLPQKAKSR